MKQRKGRLPECVSSPIWRKLVLFGQKLEPLANGTLRHQQWKWLKQCLIRNPDTHIGHQYCFSTIQFPGSFARQIPS